MKQAIKKILQFCLIFCFTIDCCAGEHTPVLIVANSVSSIDATAFALRHPDFIPYSNFLLRQSPSPSEQEELLNLFAQARSDAFSEDSARAQSKFQKIIETLQKKDWTPDVRGAFITSIIERLKGTTAPQEQEDLISKLILLDSDHSGVITLSPELRRVYDRLRVRHLKQWKTRSVLEFRQAGFRYILLNTHVFDLARTIQIQLPPGTSRITLLSDRFESVSKVGVQKELYNWSPDPQKLDVGTCDKPKASWTGDLQRDTVIYFGNSCVGVSRRGEGHVAQSERNLYQTFWQPRNEFEHRMPTPSSSAPLKSESIFKKPYFWIGISIIAGLLIKQELDRNKETGHVERIARPVLEF